MTSDQITNFLKDHPLISVMGIEKELTHGGKRQNSGAKQKYGEPTKTVTFRIPASKIKDVKKLVSDYLKSFII